MAMDANVSWPESKPVKTENEFARANSVFAGWQAPSCAGWSDRSDYRSVWAVGGNRAGIPCRICTIRNCARRALQRAFVFAPALLAGACVALGSGGAADVRSGHALHAGVFYYADGSGRGRCG